MPVSYRTPIHAALVEVIQTRAARGAGVVGDPVREVVQYWSKDGELLAEQDPNASDPLERLRAVAEEVCSASNRTPPEQRTPLIESAIAKLADECQR